MKKHYIHDDEYQRKNRWRVRAACGAIISTKKHGKIYDKGTPFLDYTECEECKNSKVYIEDMHKLIAYRTARRMLL